MANNAPRQVPQNVVIEYENADLTPVYVEAAQAVRTPKGALQISFYSEYIKPLSEVRPRAEVKSTVAGAEEVKINLSQADPFGLDTENITIVRRVEASLILTAPVLQSIIPWLQQKLDEMVQGGPTDAPAPNTR